MGRKVHPTVYRLGINKTWDARWYAQGPQYAEFLREDLKIRNIVRDRLQKAGLSKIEIERFAKQIIVTLHTAKPGIVIGRRGASVNDLRKHLEEMTGKKVRIEVKEIKRPELDAYLVAESIVEQLERRISHKRAMKQAISRTMRAGAQGIRIMCGGRLSGSEMARREWQREGRVPLQTLRADIDYAKAEALTTFGRIGVKVWIYKGEVMPEAEETEEVVVAE
ncbi:MAG: 30S ribosomal protein S3 [Chloroflexi bacterium]|nr:30S ribosomal protein S3 [Chloroflexota bacterium]